MQLSPQALPLLHVLQQDSANAVPQIGAAAPVMLVTVRASAASAYFMSIPPGFGIDDMDGPESRIC
jgi:hypothetical protein